VLEELGGVGGLGGAETKTGLEVARQQDRLGDRFTTADVLPKNRLTTQIAGPRSLVEQTQR